MSFADGINKEELSFLSEFESISTIDPEMCRKKLEKVSGETLVKAWMGTSPENAGWIATVFPEVDFEKASSEIGRIRISEIEAAQEAVLDVINER